MPRTMSKAKVQDPDGVEWQRKASARWDRLLAKAEGDGEAANAAWAKDPEPLPKWKDKTPAHVTREVLGRFLEDRTTGTIHDVYAAKPECALDGIQEATFWHFLAEVQEGVPEGVPCDHCIP